MWNIIAGILAAIVGFGAGVVGLTGNQATDSTQPVDTYSVNLCYTPDINVNLKLTWPDNFTGIADLRPTLNPGQFPLGGAFPILTQPPLPPDLALTPWPTPDNTYWEQYKNTRLTPVPNGPPQFSSLPGCQNMMLTDALTPTPYVRNSRTYIRVRQNLRVASCKTDEWAGPYNGTPNTTCGTLGPWAPANLNMVQQSRGMCELWPYPDLRKVAEVKRGGENLEIFWVPLTHNVGCNYDPGNPNCGGSNANLRDFIYVLRKRDAFDPINPSDCKVLWDAGSTDKAACSHYFDVYMAEDLYEKMKNILPSDDRYYFLKQVVENCKEESVFLPLIESSGVLFPPSLLDKPFVSGNFYFQQENKIQPDPSNNFEVNNYTYFVLSTNAINPLISSLIQIPSFGIPLNVCQPAPTPATTPGACYAPLGGITFKKSTNELAVFNAYFLANAPNSFSNDVYLKDKSGQDQNIYKYAITESSLPQNTFRAPALQLKSIDFASENMWTWATPACKPALYFYPEKPTDLNVKVRIDGQITKSNPSYDPQEGWNIKARPDGTISVKDTSDGGEATTSTPPRWSHQDKTYPYLYYEADIKGVEIPKSGWVVQSSKFKVQSSKLMKEIGFNEKEIADFLAYWLPRLQDKPYYFVTLLPEKVINEKEALSFSVNPDTLIRVRFVFEGLDGPMSVVPPANLPKYERRGFVVTDWGGTLVGKSCEDISVE